MVSEHDLATAEVDLAQVPSPALVDSKLAVGRILLRGLDAGDSLRQAHLKSRQWFAAGDIVKVVAVGPGFAIARQGEAMTPGIEGQVARVKTDNGRVLQGTPTAERQMELPL